MSPSSWWTSPRAKGPGAASSDPPPLECRTNRFTPNFRLDLPMMKRAAGNGTVFATFTNPAAAEFALNWARLLHSLGIRSLIGTSDRWSSQQWTATKRRGYAPAPHGAALSQGPAQEAAAAAAGAALFCADGPQMQRNGQAGRWAEVRHLLRLAAHAGLSVLVSDSDIAWIRDPRPYFEAALRAHPSLDFLLLTDKAFNGYSTTPLRVQPLVPPGAPANGVHGLRRSAAGGARHPRDRAGGAGGGGGGGGGPELELENAFASSISYAEITTHLASRRG